MEDFSFENLKPYSGLVVATIGGGVLFAAICNANWLFSSDPKSFNIEKIAGLVNFFGRNVTRFIVGIAAFVGMILGLIWFWYDLTHN